jgi:uncharacterized membrane protein YkvI
VIGGGYATGRELAEYFMPSGPWGGLAGMVLSTVIWSVVCATTFVFAHNTRSLDYQTFFKQLLGRFAFLFEILYVIFLIFLLAVFCAAAGAIGAAVFGWSRFWGTTLLVVGIAYYTAFGNASVERLFTGVSILLYATYALFVVIALTKFGGRVLSAFADHELASNWVVGGATYAAYNILGAVVVLPVTRHLQSSADAVKAGLLAGPLAMVPAFLFFICMCAFYPQIAVETLPSDFLLRKMSLPSFHIAFQLMIFAALLESGTGAVHAVNERIARAYRRTYSTNGLSAITRLAISSGVLIASIVLAERFGLAALIARGYRVLACVTLTIYLMPLMTYGVWRLWKYDSAEPR